MFSPLELVDTRCLAPVSLAAVPAPVRRIGEDGAVQVLTSWVLNKVLAPARPADAAATVAVTTADLWPGAGWNFCFGEGRPRDRVGVWSVHRQRDPSLSPRAERLALRRSLKIAVHETGHLYSLLHCVEYPCVQAGVNSLEEADRAPLWWCPECEIKLAWATRSDLPSRYERLAGFCEGADFGTDARFFRDSMAAVRGC